MNRVRPDSELPELDGIDETFEGFPELPFGLPWIGVGDGDARWCRAPGCAWEAGLTEWAAGAR